MQGAMPSKIGVFPRQREPFTDGVSEPGKIRSTGSRTDEGLATREGIPGPGANLESGEGSSTVATTPPDPA